MVHDLNAEGATQTQINLYDATPVSTDYGAVFRIGSLSGAKVIAITADNAPFQIYIQSNTNALADASSFIGAYIKVENTTVDQPYNRMQALLVNTRLNYDVYDAYAVQGHVTVATEMKTAATNAHITGISGKAVMTANATKGWVTALLGIIEGAGTASEMCSVCSLVQEAGCGAAQEMLYINNDGTATTGIKFVGNFTKGIDFSTGTWSQGAGNFCISYGTAATPVSVTPTGSIVPLQFSIASIADSGTPGDEFIGAGYFKTKAITAHQPNHQLATLMVRTYPSKNIWDAYGLQSHLILDTSMQTTGNNAHLTAISGKVTLTDAPTITKGWVSAILGIWEGTGTISQMGHVCSLVNEAGSTGCQAMLHLNDDVGTVPYFSFQGADGSGKGIYTHTAAGTQIGTIKVLINNVPGWIPFMQAE
jgi:hypothetical protein